MSFEQPVVRKLRPKDSVPFQCRRCGACCRHLRGQLMVESLDAYRLANYLRTRGRPDLEMVDIINDYTEPDILKKSETFTKPQEEKKEAGENGAGAAAGGKPVMDAEKCVYCTLCAKKCPQEAIQVERKEKIWKLDEEKCVECGICAGACPKKAIEMKG